MELHHNDLQHRWELREGFKILIIMEMPDEDELDFWRRYIARRRERARSYS
jgi:hypothetical protein